MLIRLVTGLFLKYRKVDFTIRPIDGSFLCNLSPILSKDHANPALIELRVDRSGDGWVVGYGG
jgi:hypothetical protein